MKLTIATFLVLATLAVYVEANLFVLMQTFQNSMRTCKRKTGATEDDINTFKKIDVPETRSGQCFIICVTKKVDFVSADNKMNLVKIRELATSFGGQEGKYNKIINIIEVCSAKDIADPDECVFAKKMMTCFKENGLSMNMMAT